MRSTIDAAIRLIVSAAILFGVAVEAHAQQGMIYEEPGIYRNRDYISYHPGERIDPFTGRLQIHHVDLHIPGNGGLDLTIQRSYNNLQVVQGPPPPAGILGQGWDLHFGRLSLGATGSCSPTYWGGSVGQNPVLTLPDGSSHVVYAASTGYPGAMTKGWWKAECAPSPAIGMVVISPEGIRHEMTQSDGAGGFLTKRIVDRNGNSIDFSFTVQFDGAVVVTGISASDGRAVTLSYGSSGAGGRSRLTSISTEGRTYSYSYQVLDGNSGNGYFQLVGVNGPAGLSWGYAYYGALSNQGGSYSLQRVTLPYGGTITYGYQWKNFTALVGAVPVTVVTSKSTSDGGNWTFSYTPSQSQGVRDITTMVGPEGTTTWKHFGYYTISNGEVWKLGLIDEKTTGSASLHREVFTWDKRQVSSQTDFRSPPYAGKSDVGSFVPILTRRDIYRDSTLYSTQFASHDIYGNTASITETGQFTRTTTRTFWINIGKWIVKQLANESIAGVGTISRSFDTNGNPYSVTRFGVDTTFGVDGQGNISSHRNARGFTRSYLSYRRGVPQSEIFSSPAVSISRVVDGAGNVTSETDGEVKTTLFGYDLLNRIVSVNPPAGTSSTVTWSFPSKLMTVTRGALVETTTFDGFGRPIRVNRGGIVRTMDYDALGRRTFESYPGSSYGTSFQYDNIGRVTRTTHGDGYSRTTAFLAANQERVTDERNRITTRTFRSSGNPDAKELMSINVPQAGADVTIGRNAHGDITSLTQNGITRTFTYYSNPGYFLHTMTDPEVGTTTLGRDAVGNMISRSVGTSGTTTYTVDGLDRTTLINYPGTAASVSRDYDRRNLLTRVSSAATGSTPAIARDLDYDGNRNLVMDKLSMGSSVRQLTFTYNGNDHLSTITYPSGMVVSYFPDALGRPTKALPHVTVAGHHPSGNLSSMTMANGVTTTFSEQAQRQWPNGISVSSGTIAGINYIYDPEGNPTSITDSANSANSRTLTYDEIGRLATASGPWASGTIAYNGSGDITSQFFGGVNTGYVYSGSRLSTVTMTGQTPRSLSYDAYGNVTSNGLHTFRYNDALALDCIDCALPGKIEYAYDGLGQMVRSMASGLETHFLYGVDGRLMGEYVPGQADLKREHVYLAGKRVATRKTVTEVASSTTLAIATSPTVFGQPLTLTASVTGLSPTGSVAYKDGAAPIAGCESKPLSAGSAVCVTSALGVGTHSLSAAYGGDSLNLPSTSAPGSAVVNKASSIASITASVSNPSSVGQGVTVSVAVAAVAPGAGAPGGAVTVSSGVGPTCQVVLPAASCLLVFSTPGPKTLAASYSGDARFLASVSTGVSQRVITGGLFRDFGGDGRSDILWRRNDGFMYQWFMNGPAIIGTGGLGTPSSEWVVEAMGDISGDGKTDLVWLNTATGERSLWALDGATVVDSHFYAATDLAWRVVAVADMDGDGKGDLVWRNGTTGEVSVWRMAGIHSPTAYGLGTVETAWKLAAAGDLDGDGRADILWRHSGGWMVAWYSAGFPAFTGFDFGFLDPGWQSAGLGDYNADGAMDIVWRHAISGDVYLWLMGPGGILQGVGFGVVGLDWSIVGVGDYDGDGRSDLLWRQSPSGTVYLWRFTSPSTIEGLEIGPVGAEWTVVNP